MRSRIIRPSLPCRCRISLPSSGKCPRRSAPQCATTAAGMPITRCSGRSWVPPVVNRKGDVVAAIPGDRGGLQKLQDDFNAAGLRVFGSGWVFITVARDGKLALETKPNQDTPLMDGKRVLLGNDVWEHAYYLTSQNRRADYLK